MAKFKSKLCKITKIKVWSFCKKTIISTLTVVGFLTIVTLGLLLKDNATKINVAERAIVEVDLDKIYAETVNDSIISGLNEDSGLSFYQLVAGLAVSAIDYRVKAVVFKIKDSSLSLAQIQELRNVIKELKAKEKDVYVFSEGFGNFSGGLSEYYLATAADNIVMQPKSEVGITGISIEVAFFRDLLKKIGINPEFYSRYEYKNAFAPFGENKMPNPMRQELSKMAEGLFEQIIDDIAKDRGIDKKRVRYLVDEAPIDDERAIKEKLVDRLDYEQPFMKKLKTTSEAENIDFKDYFYNINIKGDRELKPVAILAMSGEITDEDAELDIVSGKEVISSKKVIEQLNEIAQNEDIQALLIRIDSPGGSYGAADKIRQAINDFKQDKKIPVIASISSYGASGGYFIAIAGDKILADEASITGSIGVLGGKPVFKELWKKLNINWDGVKIGENAGMLSLNSNFSKSEKQAFNKSLDRVYKDFVEKVAKSRNIAIEKMDDLARGRVWIGKDAKKNNLVDENGGYIEMMNLASEMLKDKNPEGVRFEFYPKPKTMQEKLMEFIQFSPEIAMNKIGQDIKEYRTLLRLKYDAIMPAMVIKY